MKAKSLTVKKSEPDTSKDMTKNRKTSKSIDKIRKSNHILTEIYQQNRQTVKHNKADLCGGDTNTKTNTF